MITQIIWLLTWPLLIAISWFAINCVVNKAKKKQNTTNIKEMWDQ